MLRTAFFAVSIASLMGCTRDATPAERGAIDPAVTMALANPIMTDPELLGSANADAARPADRPYQALLPIGTPDPLRDVAAPTVVARMTPLLSAPGFAPCDQAVRYSYGWAASLPTIFELPADARVAEAAGSDGTSCRLRFIAYDVAADPAAVIAAYRRQAAVANYRVVVQTRGPATQLQGTGPGAAAFVVGAYPAKGGGSAVDLATNRGR